MIDTTNALTPLNDLVADTPCHGMHRLLAQLPHDFAANLLMTDAEIEIAEAAADHAKTQTETILQGLKTLGTALAGQGAASDVGEGQSSHEAIGRLISRLAGEALFMQATERELRHVVAQHSLATTEACL